MNRTSFVLTLALVAGGLTTACDTASVEPTVLQVEGEYALLSINGDQLPRSSGGGETLESGTMNLANDTATFTFVSTLEDGSEVTWNPYDAGPFTVSGQTITITQNPEGDDVVMSGTIDGQFITLSDFPDGGDTAVFEKE